MNVLIVNNFLQWHWNKYEISLNLCTKKENAQVLKWNETFEILTIPSVTEGNQTKKKWEFCLLRGGGFFFNVWNVWLSDWLVFATYGSILDWMGWG